MALLEESLTTITKTIKSALGDKDEKKKEETTKTGSENFLPAFHFNVSFSKLKVDDKEEEPGDIAFCEVSGIGAELQIEEVVEGGENQFVHRLPKPAKYSNLKLKKAMTAAPSLLIEWAEQAIYYMKFSTCTVTVSIMKDDKHPLASWKFEHAYPVKLEISDLDAKKGEIVIETLELAYRYSQRVKTAAS